MATKYSTLSLPEEQPARKSRAVTYAIAGFAVVALAGAAAFFVTGMAQPNGMVDAEFDMSSNGMTTLVCDQANDNYVASLPKYDRNYSKNKGKALANACYFAFRCCTTRNEGCQTDNRLGTKCRSCLSSYAPRMVLTECRLYARKQIAADAKGTTVDCADKNGKLISPVPDQRCNWYRNEPAFDADAIRSGVVPKPNNKDLKVMMAGITSCWAPKGNLDQNAKRFSGKCFEMFSWCNEMCPRDAANTVAHAYCKKCMATSSGLLDAARIKAAAKRI
jgi:hypothetical protein